jgi:hypothetical protein
MHNQTALTQGQSDEQTMNLALDCRPDEGLRLVAGNKICR